MAESRKASNGEYPGLPYRNKDAGQAAVERATRFQELFASPSSPEAATAAIDIEFVPGGDSWDEWLERQSDPVKLWLASRRKSSLPGKNTVLLVPVFDGEAIGSVRVVVAGLEAGPGAMWTMAAVYGAVPCNRVYKVTNPPNDVSATHIELGWALGGYRYDAYKSKSAAKDEDKPPALIRLCTGDDAKIVDATLAATYMVRDLINVPAEDMGPGNLAVAATTLADAFPNTDCSITVGDDLLDQSTYYPQVHAVGRAAAADRAPRLVDLRWNADADETLVLVGKGVCYDTGGLSIKGTAGMLTMKKDMAGAAHVLGLARMIMATNLNVGLRVIIPAVENAISGSAYRPGDVIASRNNITTEVTNTDAEGRLVLADALVAACELNPALIIDYATLTGAQRIALGVEIPAFWTEDDETADKLSRSSREVDDLVWRLPLHAPYRKKLDSAIADIKNSASGGYGGAITAALYLKEFVKDSCPWIHFDMMAFNPSSKPGRPEGGEAMGIRAAYAIISARWPEKKQ
jgi:leucyl aminopeptidase